MAEFSFFYNSVPGDEREYSQDPLSLAFKLTMGINGISRLVYDDPLAVSQHPNGNFLVQPGLMEVEGFFYGNDDVLTIPTPGYLQGEQRTDLLVVRLTKSADARKTKAQILQGTNGSATPPDMIREGNDYDMCLAELRYNGAAMTVVDTRSDENLCGFLGRQYATAAQGGTADAAAANLAALREDMGLPDDTAVLSIEHGGTGAITPAEARAELRITPENIGAVNKAGDTMTGQLILPMDPTEELGAATKQYVDAYVSEYVEDALATGHAATAGEADAAVKLKTPRTIAISGGAIGTPTAFDGTEDIIIPIAEIDMAKASGVLGVEHGGTGTATMGEGSGYDADTLDGMHATAFAMGFEGTAILYADGWEDKQQNVQIYGVTATNAYIASSHPDNEETYSAFGIRPIAQGNDFVVYVCSTVPTEDIRANYVILNGLVVE